MKRVFPCTAVYGNDFLCASNLDIPRQSSKETDLFLNGGRMSCREIAMHEKSMVLCTNKVSPKDGIYKAGDVNPSAEFAMSFEGAGFCVGEKEAPIKTSKPKANDQYCTNEETLMGIYRPESGDYIRFSENNLDRIKNYLNKCPYKDNLPIFYENSKITLSIEDITLVTGTFIIGAKSFLKLSIEVEPKDYDGLYFEFCLPTSALLKPSKPSPLRLLSTRLGEHCYRYYHRTIEQKGKPKGSIKIYI